MLYTLYSVANYPSHPHIMINHQTRSIKIFAGNIWYSYNSLSKQGSYYRYVPFIDNDGKKPVDISYVCTHKRDTIVLF